MNKNFRRLRPGFTRTLQAGLTACLAVLLLAVPVAGNAQETTSNVRGDLTAPDGSPAVGVSVRITDTRTGRSNTTTTTASGRFLIGDLAVGGPYTISITSEDFAKAEKKGRIDTSVKGFARRHSPRVLADNTAREILEMMNRSKEGVLPVVEEDRLIGVLTRGDLLLHVYEF